MKLTEAQALNRIAAYCSRTERCESDVRKKLQSWELTEESIDQIIARLKKENFLNEERYCRSFINDKAKFNKWGVTKIKFELRKKNIAESMINRCLDELENEQFEQPLFDLLSSKIKTIKAANDRERNMKLIRFALGRGYSFDQIKKTLQKMDLKDDEYIDTFF